MKLIGCAVVMLIVCLGWQASAEDQGKIEQHGKASYYSGKGRKTASGRRMKQSSNTAASRTLPLGAKAKVTNLATGKSTDVTVDDRGPNVRGRVIDLSKNAARQLDMKKEGVAPVKVEAKPADQPTPQLKEKVEQATKR